MCKYRTSDGETECYYSQPQPKVMTRQEYNREISSHATCNWIEVRNQAAIAAMQSIAQTIRQGIKAEVIAKEAVEIADALVKSLKEE